MKTVVIWDTCGESNIRFFVLDGDFSHLNNVYFNSYIEGDEGYEVKLDELETIVCDDGFKATLLDSFPVHIFKPSSIFIEPEEVKVITVGMTP